MSQESAVVTYSPAYTLVPTYECFNRCSYCNFRVDAGQDTWLTLEKAAAMLAPLKSLGVVEILILSGEVHPRSPLRPAWLERIYNLCRLALEKGFLPHTNAGPLSWAEMEKLKSVNVSMGLMLEQITPRLLETVHRHAPSKVPHLRLEQLAQAGQLKIPFTTGLLLGIGENDEERRATLEAIALSQQKWGHIQEVILQPHSLGSRQSFPSLSFPAEQLPELVAQARQILPSTISLQIPPNLIEDEAILLDCLAAGARDLGGISPKDEVNPDYPHRQLERLGEILARGGWQLQPRLPVYPAYYPWLSAELKSAIAGRLALSY